MVTHGHDTPDDVWREGLIADSKRVVDALGGAGVHVEDVYDLVNTNDRYEAAIPVLQYWLQQPLHPRIKDGVARALAVRWAPESFDLLVAELPRAEVGAAYQDSIALAIRETWDGVRSEDVLVDLVKDERLGTGRFFLVWALGKGKTQESADAILEALTQDGFRWTAMEALKERPDERARAELERLASSHEDGEIRRKAATALRALDRKVVRENKAKK